MDNELLYYGIENRIPCFYISLYLSIKIIINQLSKCESALYLASPQKPITLFINVVLNTALSMLILFTLIAIVV